MDRNAQAWVVFTDGKLGSGDQTDVYQYKPATGGTTQVQTIKTAIVGAGVSTCAPTKPAS